MKNILIIQMLFIITFSIIYAQSPYTEKEQKFLENIIRIWPYIGLETVRPTETYMPYDYIHESYKRESRLKTSFSSRLLYELSTIEIHMDTLIDLNLKN